MTRSLLAGVTAAVLMLGVTACSEDEPRPQIAEPTASSSPSPEPSRSDEFEARSPKRAVELWVEGWNDLSATGDSKRISAVSAKACKACQFFIDPVRELYEDGGSIETSGWSIAALEQTSDTRRTIDMDVAVEKARGVSKSSPNQPAKPFSADREIIRFTVRSEDGAWQVLDLVTLR